MCQQPCQFFNQNRSGAIRLAPDLAAQKPVPGKNAGDRMGSAKIETRVRVGLTLEAGGFRGLTQFEQDRCEVTLCSKRTGMALAGVADAQFEHLAIHDACLPYLTAFHQDLGQCAQHVLSDRFDPAAARRRERRERREPDQGYRWLD